MQQQRAMHVLLQAHDGQGRRRKRWYGKEESHCQKQGRLPLWLGCVRRLLADVVLGETRAQVHGMQ